MICFYGRRRQRHISHQTSSTKDDTETDKHMLKAKLIDEEVAEEGKVNSINEIYLLMSEYMYSIILTCYNMGLCSMWQ